MLRQHNQFALGLLVVADAVAISVAWLLAYWLRFQAQLLPVDPFKGVPGFDEYLLLMPGIVAVHLFIFYRLRLYRPRRDHTILHETRDIVKAFFVAIVAFVVIDYFRPQSNKISRVFLLTYAVVGTSCFALFRGTVRAVLRLMRERGFNQRSAIIVGSGRMAQKLAEAIRNNGWTGYRIACFVDDQRGADGAGSAGVSPAMDVDSAAAARRTRCTAREIRGVPVVGPLTELPRLLDEHAPDAVFVALPMSESERTPDVLDALEHSLADIRVVPEFNATFAMRPNVSTLDDVPILSLRQAPLYGWNAIVKRSFDLVVGSICMSIAAGPMLLIAALVKLTSAGPVFYRQRRVGLDGQEFMMTKFRTMRSDAEKDGPVWSRKVDARRTRIGSFLRKTSLDELPNLFNVLRGEMSLVGPRPERPEFIAQFRKEIPRYMLRHKMKAGMTGFAQVKGYRGDTSIKKRIQHDVHYIRNWSLALDVRIFLSTLFGVWFSRHET